MIERTPTSVLPSSKLSIESGLMDDVVDRLVAALRPERILLFGSYAWGDPTPDSDLDLMVVVPHSSEPPHRRSQAAYRAVGAIGFPKDLLVLTREEFDRKGEVRTSLAHRVRREGIVLYVLTC